MVAVGFRLCMVVCCCWLMLLLWLCIMLLPSVRVCCVLLRGHISVWSVCVGACATCVMCIDCCFGVRVCRVRVCVYGCKCVRDTWCASRALTCLRVWLGDSGAGSRVVYMSDEIETLLGSRVFHLIVS